jgi:hypothetical protein
VKWWNRLRRWFERFLAKYGGGDTGSGGGGVEPVAASYPETPDKVIGYGPVNMRDIPAEQLARELSTAWLNTCQLEFAWWKSAEAWDNPQAAIDRAVRVVAAMRERKILTRINLWNANVGLGKYGDPVRLRLDQRPLSYYTDIIDRLIVALGTTDGVDLQGVSEWNSERARQIDEYVARRWSGLRSYNRGARPSSRPTGYWCREWHPISTGDLGPADSRCLVVSDHGNWLRQVQRGDVYGLAVPDILKDYAMKVRQTGKGFVYYGFGQQQIDSAAIRALGEVARATRQR